MSKIGGESELETLDAASTLITLNAGSTLATLTTQYSELVEDGMDTTSDTEDNSSTEAPTKPSTSDHNSDEMPVDISASSSSSSSQSQQASSSQFSLIQPRKKVSYSGGQKYSRTIIYCGLVYEDGTHCTYVTNYKKNMADHQISKNHFNARPYKCNSCKYKASNERNMRSHCSAKRNRSCTPMNYTKINLEQLEVKFVYSKIPYPGVDYSASIQKLFKSKAPQLVSKNSSANDDAVPAPPSSSSSSSSLQPTRSRRKIKPPSRFDD